MQWQMAMLCVARRCAATAITPPNLTRPRPGVHAWLQVLPMMDRVIGELARLAKEFADVPMLSRTHGQTASPTTMGKELAVFAYRCERESRPRQRNVEVEAVRALQQALHACLDPDSAGPPAMRVFIPRPSPGRAKHASSQRDAQEGTVALGQSFASGPPPPHAPMHACTGMCCRLQRQRDAVAAVPFFGKMAGAVGNYNAHMSAYPEVDWQTVGKSFVESLGAVLGLWQVLV